MARAAKIEIFKDTSNPAGPAGWYWHLVAPNGKIVLTGGESFVTRAHARRAFQGALKHLVSALKAGAVEEH